MKPKYDLVDSGDLDNHWHVSILDGPYKGIVFKFLAIRFKGEDSDGNAIIQFEHQLIELPETITIEDKADFEDTLGAILHDILLGLAEREDGKNRNNDTEELDS